MSLPPSKRVAVIGAGVSGVVAAAHLKLEGLDVIVFERAPVSGGVWVWDPDVPLEPTYPSARASVAEFQFHGPKEIDHRYIFYSGPGPCYEELKNNVPTELLELSLNPWKPNTDSFVYHSVLASYIQETAEKTGVTKFTHFNTRVTYMTKEQGQWKVTTNTWDYINRETISRQWEFDAVVVASGHYHAPKVPNVPGLAEWKAAWPLRIQHSKSYRNSKGFEGQTVLLIGGSASSTDIAKELSPVAKKVWQSTRNGQFDHPSHMLPENTTRVAQVASFNITQNDNYKEAGSISGTVTLVNGQVLENIDRVIVATGYQFSFPFLPDHHRDEATPEEADNNVLVTDGLQVHNLHKDIFYIPDPTLAFVGVPFYTATFSLFEFQAITVAAFFAGKAVLPSREEMRAEYCQRVQTKGYGKPFHNLMGKDVEYVAELMRWVNQGRASHQRRPDGYSPKWIQKRDEMRKVANPKNSLYKNGKQEIKAA